MVAYGDDTNDGVFAGKKPFYRNRFARSFPVYYVCTFLAIPLWLAGYGPVDPIGNLGAVIASIVVSVVPVCTLFIFLLGGSVNGPGWTICTLAVMWLMFPHSYPYIRKRSNEELTTDITNFYWIQFALVIVIFPVLRLFTGFWPAFAAATMHPLVRYPLFLMGAFAGELCRRREGLPLLWPNSGLGFFPACCCCKVEYDGNLASNNASEIWSNRCLRACQLFLIATASISFVDALVRYQSGDVDATILGAWWYQAIVPFIQLEIIVGLTRLNDADSVVKTFLLHPYTQYLGKISVCIYLIHWVLIYYLCWSIEGAPLKWPSSYECEDGPDHEQCVNKLDNFYNARKIPLWGIIVVAIMSLLASVVLYHLVEVPGRRLLKASNNAFPLATSSDIGLTSQPTFSALAVNEERGPERGANF